MFGFAVNKEEGEREHTTVVQWSSVESKQMNATVCFTQVGEMWSLFARFCQPMLSF